MKFHAYIIALAFLAPVVKLSPPANSALADELKGVRRFEPLSETPPNGSAGLFIGVNEFTKFGRPLKPVRYAVNDAIAMAYLFAIDLKLIPPQKCTLAI